MTPRERLQAVLAGEIPDCVPVAPDISNMIPARLTGKPFWDLYLYKDPPIWEAYVAAAKHFDIDSLMDAYFPLAFPEERDQTGPPWEEAIVFRDEQRIITRAKAVDDGKRLWAPTVRAYYRGDPPTSRLPPQAVGLSDEPPERWEPVEGVKEVDVGPAGLRRVKRLMGEQGLVGIRVASTRALRREQDVFQYYDHPEKHAQSAEQRLRAAQERYRRIMAMEVKPDFLCAGGSGTLVLQTVEIVRQLTLPAVKWVIEQAAADGMPTHVHACGPERALVKIMAEETALTVIDPLEMPPMGDCELGEIKRLYGDKLVLKGNLHTTETMLLGSPADVRRASVEAMRAAGEGGRFILSTGDQCGRDTPDENLRAMVDTARSLSVSDRSTRTLPRLARA